MSNKQERSLGPWRYERGDDQVDGDPRCEDNLPVGEEHFVLDTKGDELACLSNIKDAYLIAAAPDLDASLLELFNALDRLPSSLQVLTDNYDEMMKKAHKALMEADGGDSGNI